MLNPRYDRVNSLHSHGGGGGGWGFQLTSTLLYKLEGLLTNETSAYTYDHIQHTSGHLPSARNHHSKKKLKINHLKRLALLRIGIKNITSITKIQGDKLSSCGKTRILCYQ